jgi:delta 1-pyrroline-5-carboxylate dehydrogenase
METERTSLIGSVVKELADARREEAGGKLKELIGKYSEAMDLAREYAAEIRKTAAAAGEDADEAMASINAELGYERVVTTG